MDPTPARRAALTLFFWLLIGIGPANAQTPDTLLTVPSADSVTVTLLPDSAAASSGADSLVFTQTPTAGPTSIVLSAPAAGALPVDVGAWSGMDTPLVLPIASAGLEAVHLLRAVPGSFLYDLGAAGWPHGWSPDGMDPAVVGLSALGLSWNDPVTGRPRFDLLPVSFFEPPAVGGGRFGEAVGIDARLRAYEAPRPTTELRYRKGAAGLQAVAGTHAQLRRIRLFGREMDLHVLGGYGGRAAEGEYPGSRLRRERRVLGRVTLSRASWHLQLLNLHSRHQVGAHGGVIPRTALGLESIYDRFGARVENEGAIRRTVRNDLVAEAGLPFALAGAHPLVSGFWTAQTFRFRDRNDTLAVETDRLGLQLAQQVRSGALDPWIQLTIDRTRNVPTWTTAIDRRTTLHASLRDTLTAGPLRLTAGAGIHRRDGTFPSLSLGASVRQGIITVSGHASHGPDPAALIHRVGFGRFLEPAPERRAPQTSRARLGARLHAGTSYAALTVFAHRTTDPMALRAVAGDTVAVIPSGRALGRVGLVAELGLRAEARRGVYLALEATASRETGRSAGDPEALPPLFGYVRGGLRYLLFRGDLDLHLYVEARGWTAFESRDLHPPTGLLIEPPVTAGEIGPATTVGLYVEGGVREATIFIAWENLAAGTTLMDGTMLVPLYPLQERAFRFGVYWPIWD